MVHILSSTLGRTAFIQGSALLNGTARFEDTSQNKFTHVAWNTDSAFPSIGSRQSECIKDTATPGTVSGLILARGGRQLPCLKGRLSEHYRSRAQKHTIKIKP